MALNDFINALQAPSHIRENPEWVSNVMASLGVDIEDPLELAVFEEYMAMVANEGAAVDTEEFYNSWLSFVPTGGPLGGSSDIQTYQALYQTFFPENEEGFVSQFADFLFRSLKDAGEVIPADTFSSWFSRLTQFFLYDPTEGGPTSLAAGGYEQVRLMLKIYRIVIDVVELLQDLATAQALRLDFFGAYQESYTEQMEDLPSFLPGIPVSTGTKQGNNGRTISTGTIYVPDEVLIKDASGNVIGFDFALLGEGRNDQLHPLNATDFSGDARKEGDNWVVDEQGNEVKLDGDIRDQIEAAQEKRGDMSTLNAKYLESLRSQRSQVTNLAQAHQSVMSQANQAVNQQSDIATALIALLNGLQQSIFK